MTLQDQVNMYKSFFEGTEAGKELLERMEAVEKDNVVKAQDKNSLDYLSRSKGNREIIDLVLNVLRTEGDK